MAVSGEKPPPPPPPATASGGTARKLILALLTCLSSALLYRQIQPLPPKIPGTPGGPPVTATRTRLSDGRYLAYLETGVPREKAKHRLVFVHGFDSCRHDALPISTELAQELGVYMLSFDRPGYAESDPHPARTEESIALDIAELADNLQLGRKFYLAGFSMGGEIMWSCLKYIPHRLSGVAILGPVGNYWWPGLPSNVSRDAWYQQLPRDQWAVWVAHHLPWLTYWWNTQKLFPASSVIAYNPALLSQEDEMLMAKFGYRAYMPQIRQQGEHECLHRDMMVGFGKWSWSPLQLENPFADADADDGQGAGKVHLWHGAEDLIVPVSLSRYISQKLPWVVYHELPKSGHLFPIAEGMADIIVKSLLLGDDHPSSSASQRPHSP
uniref:Catalytic/ hydrolase n=1 Tax=Zea mays TaxID=4577 RepID=B6TDQ3_MAIZE|nr:catalytic/ hydrolase [Zea mays]